MGVDYVQGYLSQGHYELECTKEELEGKSPEEIKEFVADMGELIVDSYSVEDVGDYGEVKIEDVAAPASEGEESEKK